MFWKKKKKEYKPVKVSVFLADGRVVTHMGTDREISPSGRLHITSNSIAVADYMPGTWTGLSVGKRTVSGP